MFMWGDNMKKAFREKMRSNTDGGRGAEVAYGALNLLLTLMLSVVLLFLTAILATYLSFTDGAIRASVICVTGISVIFAGFRAARHFGSSGLLHGSLSGVLYVVMLCFIACIAFRDFGLNSNFLYTLMLGISCGGIGGIFGVNTRRKVRHK